MSHIRVETRDQVATITIDRPEQHNAISYDMWLHLERAAREAGADDDGRVVVLTGGGALLRNLDYVLRQATGLPISIADDPLTCVVLGAGRVLEEFKKLKDVLFSVY